MKKSVDPHRPNGRKMSIRHPRQSSLRSASRRFPRLRKAASSVANGPALTRTTLAAFVLGVVYLPVLIVVLSRGSFDHHTAVLAAALITVTVVAARRVQWQRLPQWCEVLPALAHLCAIALLRHSVHASNTLLSATVLLSVISVAVRGNRAQMATVLIGIGAVFDVPVLLLDETKYGTADVGHGIVLLMVGAAIGLALVRSVERLHKVEDALISTENRFQSMFESAPIGTALVDRNGVVVMANDAYVGIFGSEQTRHRPLVDIVHPDDAEDLRETLKSVFAGAAAPAQTRRRSNGIDEEERWVELRQSLIRDAHDQPEFVLVHVLDVTDRERLESQLHFQANHDPLTGLLNRRGFGREFARHVALAERYGHGGALLMLDLDGFKRVNDTLGHTEGDALLRNVASALRTRLRDTDIVARFGGDEFAVIIPNSALDQALAVADAVIATIGAVTAGEGSEVLHVTASVGLALFNAAASAEAMLFDADLAMYEAKELGKNRVVVASQKNNRPVVTGPAAIAGPLAADERERRRRATEPIARTWIERMSAWLESDEFVLEIEPTIDLRPGADTSYELHVRVSGASGVPATIATRQSSDPRGAEAE